MRFCCFVVSLFLLPGFGFASSNVAVAVSSEPLSIERRLSNGESCTIKYQSASEGAGGLNITLLVSGAEIRIPAECLADLSDCNVPDGVQVADFAGDIFLLLAGGEGDSSWQAKLTIRDQRVTERELQKRGGQPKTTAYARPWDVHDGQISSEERELKTGTQP
jgi:hypothetical protein